MADEPLTFEAHIWPIFRAHCFDCHGAQAEVEGGLDLRLVRFQLEGGDSGPAIVPHDPEESYLVQRLMAGEMPPGEGKVSDDEIAILKRWIAQGAVTAEPEPESIPPGIGITSQERSWWAYQPLAPSEPPAIDDPRVRTPIDAFLRAAMPEGLSFSPDADKRTLIQRAYFDLIGLPPSQLRVDAFLADESPDAYERLIDELLASSHYGERWARHWLDVAGYADSEGATSQDAVRPWAYKYRDYVIRALNSDKPFDRFLLEQLAGDELAGPVDGEWTPEQIELLTATGFLRMAADGTGSGDNSPEARHRVIADSLKIVGSSLLGLTIACAECHDHRYDPIPQTDYYALRAVFEPAWDWQSWKTPAGRQISLYTAADRAQAAEIEAEAQTVAAERAEKQAQFMAEALDKELARYEPPLRDALRAAYETPADQRSDEQKLLLDQNPSVNISPGTLYQYNQAAADELKTYDQRIGEIRAKKPVEQFVRAMTETPGTIPETTLFHRGDYRQPREVVPPRALTVLSSPGEVEAFEPDDPAVPTSGRRTAFAEWLTSESNPLTPRVLANRIWLHHFGRGLVETPADFGKLGTLPSHPELLDWLALEFRNQGWSLKQMHRTIMLSTAYRQASQHDPAKHELDSSNRYYWRQEVVRLDAETLRDRVLATTDQLDRKLFGPPMNVMEDETGQVIVESSQRRRSLYILQRRTQPVALLQAFDAPVMQTNCELRPSSTVATQSLMLMNGSFLLQQSERLAERSMRQPTSNLPGELLADLPTLPSPREPLWQFGYGDFDSAADRTASFTPLPHWTGSAWQGAVKLPAETIGWVSLHARGGHPGGGANRAAIRRFTVPVAGVLTIRGSLEHASENGDGVRGRVVSSRAGSAGDWTAFHGSSPTNVNALEVVAGDTVDLIVDCQAHETSDSFGWQVELELNREDGTSITWRSEEGFHGPVAGNETLDVAAVCGAWQAAYLRLPQPDELQLAMNFLGEQLNYLHEHPENVRSDISPQRQALANLCQVLLSSNEFLYVD